MKKLLLLLPILFIQAANAQEYKKLTSDDVSIATNESKSDFGITILKKDKTPLSEGYYSTPFYGANTIISFYIAPNGKLNKTAKSEDGQDYTLIPLEDNLVNGTMKIFSKNILTREVIFEKGNRTAEKQYQDKKLISETIFADGNTVMTKTYVNGKLESSKDEIKGIDFTYYDDGKTVQSSRTYKGHGSVTITFDNKGKILKEITTEDGIDPTIIKYYHPAGVLIAIDKMDGTKITTKKFNTKGKVIKTSVKDYDSDTPKVPNAPKK